MALTQQPTTETKPHFLSMSREIRALIYTALLQSPNSPPLSPEDAGRGFGKSGILYSDKQVPDVCYAALLRCNRQVSTEFHESVFACQSIPDLKLDCMVKGYAVWPTWISPLYPEPRKIGNLDLDLRLFDVGNGGGQFWGDGRCSARSFLTRHRPFGRKPSFTRKDGNDLGKVSSSIPTLKMDWRH